MNIVYNKKKEKSINFLKKIYIHKIYYSIQKKVLKIRIVLDFIM